MRDFLLVGAGGFAGSVARYAVSMAMSPLSVAFSLPVGTFTVNATGSFVIGVLLAVMNQNAWYFLGVVGFCGGYTTFSAFSAEMFNLLRGAHYANAALYAAASMLICLLAVWLGHLLGLWIKLKIL